MARPNGEWNKGLFLKPSCASHLHRTGHVYARSLSAQELDHATQWVRTQSHLWLYTASFSLCGSVCLLETHPRFGEVKTVLADWRSACSTSIFLCGVSRPNTQGQDFSQVLDRVTFLRGCELNDTILRTARPVPIR
jgi:hypothetical protein